METTVKSGTSAGARKGWAHRKRGSGRAAPKKTGGVRGAIGRAGRGLKAFAGRVKANPKSYAKRTAKLIGGLYVKKYGRRLIGKSYRSLLRGKFRSGVTQNMFGNRLKKLGDEMIKTSLSGKEADMCASCGKKPAMKGEKHCPECAKEMKEKELSATFKRGTSSGASKGWKSRARFGLKKVVKAAKFGLRKTKKNLKYGVGKTKRNAKFGFQRLKSGLTQNIYKEQSRVYSYKDASDRDCFVLVAGGSYEDGDGQWIKREAYDKWITSLKSNDEGFLVRPNGEEVVYRWWHVGKPDPKTGSRGPGADLGKFNYIERIDNFVVAAGVYDSKEIAEAFAPHSDEHGASLGFFHPSTQPKDGEYDDVDGFEISALPKEKASFPYTVALN